MPQTPTLPDAATADVPRSWSGSLGRLRSFRVVWPLAALAVLLAYNAVFTDGFFHVQLTNGRLIGTPVLVLNRAASVVLLGIGMTLVIATGGIDLSVGATMALTATVMAQYAAEPPVGHGGSAVLGCLIGLALAGACGGWNGLLVAVFDIQPFVATLILMIGGRGIAANLLNQTVPLRPGALAWLHNLPDAAGPIHRLLYPLPLEVVWAGGAAIVAGLLVRRTALGLFLESVGNNPVASRYAGIQATGVKFAAYLVCGLTAGMAGLIEAGDQNGSKFGLGLTRELDAILAVSLGGTALAGGRFSIAGTVVGAVIIGALEKTIRQTQIGGHNIRDEWFGVAEALVIVAVCLLQSDRFRAALFGWVPRPGRVARPATA